MQNVINNFHFYLKHEPQHEDHGNAGHDVRMVLDHELVAEHWRRLAGLPSLGHHGEAVTVVKLLLCVHLQLTNRQSPEMKRNYGNRFGVMKFQLNDGSSLFWCSVKELINSTVEKKQ